MDYNGMQQQQQLQQHDQQQQEMGGGQNGGGYQAGYPSMEAPSPQAYSPEQNGGIAQSGLRLGGQVEDIPNLALNSIQLVLDLLVHLNVHY